MKYVLNTSLLALKLLAWMYSSLVFICLSDLASVPESPDMSSQLGRLSLFIFNTYDISFSMSSKKLSSSTSPLGLVDENF